jgi:hypothetical protein
MKKIVFFALFAANGAYNLIMKKLLVSIIILMSACEIEIRVPTVYVIDAAYDTSADVYEFDDTAEHCDNRTECSAAW